MTTNDRCPVRDRPVATAEQWKTMRGGDGVDLRWGGSQCLTARVDWRARALAAEASRDEARALIGAINRGDVPLCEECGTALAMQYDDNGNPVCDAHAGGIVCRRDLPHAAALRAAGCDGGCEVNVRHYGPAQLAALERGEVLNPDDARHLALMLAAEREDSAREQAATVFALELVAALDAYAATDGRPWAERIAARKRVDEARAAVARMEGGR